MSIKLATSLVLLSLSAASEAAEIDCVAIEDPSERLACFDAVFGNAEKTEFIEAPVESDDLNEGEPEPASAEPTAAGEPAVAAEPAAAEPIEPAAAVVVPATVPTEPDASEQVAAQEEKRRGFLGDELVNITSTITAILAGDKQKMVFELENGQIWLQSSPRSLPFKEGDVVTVKNALLGGYFLRSEKGVSTRVNRIR